MNNVIGGTYIRVYEVARLEDETRFRAESRYEATITKEPRRPWIENFDASDEWVRAGDSTVLTWSATPGATLMLSYADSEIDVTDKNGVFTVSNLTRLGLMRFDLTAFVDGASSKASTWIEVRRRPPRIVEFSGERRADGLYVSWRTEFTSRCKITGHPGYFSPTERDVKITGGSAAFVRLIAFSVDDESVARDLFDYEVRGEVRIAPPLPAGSTPQVGCSFDGSMVFFNDAPSTFKIARPSDFPASSGAPCGRWLAFNADGSRYATVEGSTFTFYDASNRVVSSESLSFYDFTRVDFPPDGGNILANGIASSPRSGIRQMMFSSQTGVRNGYWDVGPMRYLSRGQRAYVDYQSDHTIWSLASSGTSGLVRFGTAVSAIASDDREIAYAALRDTNEVAVFDGRNPAAGVRQRIKVGRAPTGLAMTGREVIVANSGDSFLSVIDIETLNVDTIPVPQPMCAVAFSRRHLMIFAYTAARDRVVRLTLADKPLMAKAGRPESAVVEVDQREFPKDFTLDLDLCGSWIVWSASEIPNASLTLSVPGAGESEVGPFGVQRAGEDGIAVLRAVLPMGDDAPPLVAERSLLINAELLQKAR